MGLEQRTVWVKLPEEVIADVDRLAADKERSRSWQIRQFVLRGLASEREPERHDGSR